MIASFDAPTRLAPIAVAAKSIANEASVSTPRKVSVTQPTR